MTYDSQLMPVITIKEAKSTAAEIFSNLDINETSRKDYAYRIGSFLDFININGFHRNSFLDYKRALESRKDYAVSTKNKYLISARVWLKELNRKGHLPADITQNVKSFRQDKKHKKEGITGEEFEKIKEWLNNHPENTRLRALVLLLAFQGLRQIEAQRLDVQDLNLVSGTAAIQGKGMDDKEIIYLHPEVIKALKAHIRLNKVGSGALFKSPFKKSERLSTKTFKRIIGEVFNELGIEKTVHGFRHWYCTSLLNSGMDLRTVRKFSRHKNVEMLIIYDDAIDIKNKVKDVFKCFTI